MIMISLLSDSQHQVSILSTFYSQLCCTKVFFAKLIVAYILALKFFLLKKIGTKAARKMLMKLTAGVNFTNI
jgi:hypothetical protein